MIVIIDYNMGNLRSIAKALEFLGADVIISNNPEDLEKADKIVLPGVGAFRDGIENLRKNKLDVALYTQVMEHKKPLLGICLGMQLLADTSYEFGEWKGLGFIHGEIHKFVINTEYKIPHIGWNNIKIIQEHPLLKGIQDNSDFYFVHSYCFTAQRKSSVVSTCNYDLDFTAIIAQDNIFAVQFHPEKSQKNGLKLLENFINWKV